MIENIEKEKAELISYLKKYPVTETAKIIGVPHSSISRIIHGKQRITIDNLVKYVNIVKKHEIKATRHE